MSGRSGGAFSPALLPARGAGRAADLPSPEKRGFDMMDHKGKRLDFFLAANSPVGFASYFGALDGGDPAFTTYILGGCPGCGKSTLLRRVGEALLDRGETVEFIHCASDQKFLALLSLNRMHLPQPLHHNFQSYYNYNEDTSSYIPPNAIHSLQPGTQSRNVATRTVLFSHPSVIQLLFLLLHHNQYHYFLSL